MAEAVMMKWCGVRNCEKPAIIVAHSLTERVGFCGDHVDEGRRIMRKYATAISTLSDDMWEEVRSIEEKKCETEVG